MAKRRRTVAADIREEGLSDPVQAYLFYDDLTGRPLSVIMKGWSTRCRWR